MHTPTPWRYIKKESLIIGKSEICSMAEFRDGSGDYPNAEINAEFIVTAVNAHEDLVNVIQEFDTAKTEAEIGLARIHARQALAKAGIKL